MKFRKVITLIGTLRKQDFYDFVLSEKEIREARKRTWENPFLVNSQGSVMALYYRKGKLRVNYFISYYGFKEGYGNHTAKEFDNVVLCSCGKRFPQGKRKLGMGNFEVHFQQIEKLKKEDKK